MPTLTGVTYRTVTGSYRRMTGGPAVGSLAFLPSVRLVTANGDIVVPYPIEVTLDASGDLTVSLPVNDDPQVTPSGWTWLVIERIDGKERSWSFELPEDDGTPVDLADVAPTDPVSPATSYILASSVDGLVTAEELEDAVDDAATDATTKAAAAQAAAIAAAATDATTKAGAAQSAAIAAAATDATSKAGAAQSAAIAAAATDATTKANAAQAAAIAAAATDATTKVTAATSAEITRANGAYAALADLPLNALDYAVGDGTTDDTDALETWLAAAASAGRSAVAPKRTYLISGSLDIPTGSLIDWQGSTVKVADGTAASVSALRIMGTRDITIRNLRVDGNSGNRTLGASHPSISDEAAAGNGIAFRTNPAKDYAQDVTLENIYVKDVPGYCFSMRGCERVLVRGCTADGFGDDGFDVGGSNTGFADMQPARMIAITNCVAMNGTAYYSANCNGFEVDDGANHVTISNCLAQDNPAGGFECHPHPASAPPHDITVTGCVARNNGERGIRFESTDATQVISNITIVGNVVTGTGIVGINVSTARAATVADNTCEGLRIQVKGSGDGVVVSGNHASRLEVDANLGDIENLVVKGNVFRDADSHAIYLNGTGFYLRRPVIASNVVDTVASPYHAIHVEDVADVASIVGNTLSGLSRRGIYATSTAVVHVEGNVVLATEGTTQANGEAICVESANPLIVGNTVVGGRDCIIVSGADAVIAGNRLRSPGNNCINLNGGARPTVTGNRMTGGQRGLNGVSGATDASVTGNVFSGGTFQAIQQAAGADNWIISGNNYRGQTNVLSGTGNHVTGTAAELLASLLTVDGAGSGLDADLLDGLQGSAYGLASMEGRWPSGAFLQPEGTLSTATLTADRLYYLPLWVPEARTTASIDVEVTVAGTGGTPTLRVGLYSPDANGRPGALLVDAGTVDASAPALLSKAVSQAVPRGLVWVAVVAQGATSTQPTVRTVSGATRFANYTALQASTTRSGYSQNTVAGALPANATPVTTTLIQPPYAALKAA